MTYPSLEICGRLNTGVVRRIVVGSGFTYGTSWDSKREVVLSTKILEPLFAGMKTNCRRLLGTTLLQGEAMSWW
jgi:hypothetical protein